MMAIAISHQDGQSSLLLMAFDLQLAIIVIFCHHAGHFNHDCWHHHNHDITQNLAEKSFFFIETMAMTTVMATLPSLLW